MNMSTKCGLLLISMLVTISIGVAIAEKDNASYKLAPINELNTTKMTGSNLPGTDSSDVKENESADKNVETSEDNPMVAVSNPPGVNSILIGNISYGVNQWVELKNNGTLAQNITGWMLEVQNKTVFSFPKFTLGTSATVIVHSGMGTNTKTALYTKSSLFTKTNDEVSLLDMTGSAVSASEEPKEKSDQPNDA
jgi:hypothetical protein